MPYAYSQQSTASSVGVLANIAERHEQQYRKYIEQNETMGTGIAMRLARGEHFEGLLGREVAEECREKLRCLARDNVSKDRQLRAYVRAMKVVVDDASSKLQTQQQHTQEEDTTTNTTNTTTMVFEFKERMESEYAVALDEIAGESVEITQEPSYLQVCKHLGEDQEEDDELAVVAGNNGGGSSGHNDNKIKCPLTMGLMEDPVRSRVCKHSFQRSAIAHHLKRYRNCPVPGCVNGSMTTSELEEDPETMMRVRRYKTRETATKKARAQTALDMDDGDEFEF